MNISDFKKIDKDLLEQSVKVQINKQSLLNEEADIESRLDDIKALLALF